MKSACAVLYCHPWHDRLCHVFPHYLMEGTILGRTLLNKKRVFRFSVQLLFETFLILRTLHLGIIINVHWSSSKVPLILVTF